MSGRSEKTLVAICRVLRGGSAWNNPRNLRSANRNRNEPKNRNDNIGLRCVRRPRRQHAAGWHRAGPARTGYWSAIPCPPVPVGCGRTSGRACSLCSMMRTIPSGSFERLSSLHALWRAYQACRRGKRRQPRMATFDIDADRHLCALHRTLIAGRYHPDPWRLRVIHDPKVRLIAAPSIRDRIVHRALLDEIGPHYERSFIEHSCTGAAGRGPHRAVLQHLRWLRRYGYRLGLDIRRYFPSIHHPTLCRLLFRKLRDRGTQALITQLLAAGGEVYRTPLARRVMQLEHHPVAETCGLALGSYLSQWCGTFYLDGLDHFVKRELKIPGYLRYMDDFVLFSDNRSQLAEARTAIATWLAEERRLQLHPKRWDVIPNKHPSIFLGYRISRAGITPSRKLRRSMSRRLRGAARKGHAPLVRSIESYRGLLLF
jgi:RNA-directed DNA polymerase